MTGGISNISVQPQLSLPKAMGGAANQGAQGTTPSFKDYLLDSIKEVNAMQNQADKAVESLATGGDVNPTEVMTAVQKADLAFRMMMQIRNKLVSAYQEIQSIRV